MRINIGTIYSNCDGFDSIANITASARGLAYDSIELDFSRCDFFDANMAAPLFSAIALLRNDLNDVTVANVQPKISRILRKNTFMSVFNFPDLKDTNETTLPFRIFKLNAERQFYDYLEHYMTGRGIPAMSKALTKHYRQNLFEVFYNATIHSESEFGVFVCGQFYPNNQRMDFTIADAGIGIRENVRRYMEKQTISSIKAIEWALEEGHTTKDKDKNEPGGLGFNLIKEFIEMNRGKIQVVSRFGYYEFSVAGEVSRKLNNDFLGTCINIEINTSDKSKYRLKSEINSKDIF